MGNIDYRFIKLTFISSNEEIKKQITNTVIFSFLEEKFNNVLELNNLLENTRYGFNASALNSGKNKFLRISDIKDGKVNWENVPFCNCPDEKTYLLYSNDILIARTGGTTGKSYLINEPPKSSVFAGYLIRLRTNQKILPAFLNLFLNSYAYWSQILEMKSGSAQPNVNAEKLKKLLIPYCPIEEQEEILNLLNNLKTDKKNWQELIKAINYVQEKFENHNEFSELLMNQQILAKKFRQSILLEAMEGKLVNQNKNDEPAKELLKRNEEKKEQLIKQGGLKKEKPLSSITSHKIPEGWVWCRLTDIIENSKESLRRGPFGSSITKSMFVPASKQAIKVYEQKNAIYKNYELGNYYIDISKYPNLKSFFARPGDILISCAGTIGETYLLPEDAPSGIINQALLKIKLNNEIILNEYFIRFFHSVIRDKVNADSKGSAMKNLGSINYLKENLLIPLPPLPEQKRIIEKIDQLMKVCDELDTQIIESHKNEEVFIQTVLRETFRRNSKS